MSNLKGGKAGRRNTPESRLRNGAELRKCAQCGADFWVSRSQRETVAGGGTYCGAVCRRRGVAQKLQGRRDPNKELVIRHAKGYLLEYAPDHPRAAKSSGRVLQHILVAEAMLGRPLAANEQVHHRNHQRDDNRPENLEIMDKFEHSRMHIDDRLNARGPQIREHDPKTGRFRSAG